MPMLVIDRNGYENNNTHLKPSHLQEQSRDVERLKLFQLMIQINTNRAIQKANKLMKLSAEYKVR